MKQYKRLLTGIVALLLCLSLCGCDRLDDLQSCHAVWQEDGTILWNDIVYKPLPTITDAECNLSRWDDMSVYVTEADVPVLLSTQYGDYFKCDPERLYLRGYVNEVNGRYYGDYLLFCREDRYEETAAKLGNGFLSAGLCYDYYDYQQDAMRTYYVTSEQEYAISYILDTAEWFVYDDEFYGEYEVELYRHDALDLYRSFEMRLAYGDGNYYVLKDDITYFVKAEYEQIMRDVLQVGYSAYSQRQKEWYE